MNLLFLCTGNSCRSQIAEGFCRHMYAGKHVAYSAGTLKTQINPYAVKVMQEIGIDITSQFSKTLAELSDIKFDVVFTVCSNADQNCPFIPGAKIIHKGFDDPPHLTEGLTDELEKLKIYRRVRDEIKIFIQEIQTYLEKA